MDLYNEPQQRSTSLSHTVCRALGGDESPGCGAAKPTQLHGLTSLVWVAGNHCRLGWHHLPHGVMEQNRLQKYSKAPVKPIYCTGDWVVDAKAREAALIGKCLRNTDFQCPADPMSTVLSCPHVYLLPFLFKTPAMLNLLLTGQRLIQTMRRVVTAITKEDLTA